MVAEKRTKIFDVDSKDYAPLRKCEAVYILIIHPTMMQIMIDVFHIEMGIKLHEHLAGR